jgi:cardiolipin synthase A/B
MEFFKSNIWEIIIIANYIIVVVAVFSIILSNINPIKTLSYILVLVTLPFVGLVVYYFFGQEYRKNKIFKRKNILDQIKIKQWQKKLELKEDELKEFEKNVVNDKIKLVKLLHRDRESPLTKYNKVDVLINGEAKFEKLFKDIKNAKLTIHLEYYIFIDDELGKELIDLLCHKSLQGIKVRLSYDYVGSSISNKSKRKLRKSGVEFYAFMPVYFPKFTSKLNYRNHRKIVVIDGKIGYIGGVNIADRYRNKNPKTFWRDTHLRIEGEAVGVLQLHFMLNWDFLTPYDVIVEDHFFPKITVTDKMAIQIAASGPDTDWANIMEAIFTAINTAERYIYITTPYFIPNDEIITALTSAAKSGIAIKLIIPYNSDLWIAKYATFSFMEILLRAGVKVYLYKKGFIHAKTMIIDDIFTIIGTSNIDNRSFHINFEINALIYDNKVAQITLKSFEEDIKHSKEIVIENWMHRKRSQKLKESFCRLLSPLL